MDIFGFDQQGSKRIVKAVRKSEAADLTAGKVNGIPVSPILVTGFSSDTWQGNSNNPCAGVEGFSGQAGFSGCCAGDFSSLAVQICFDKNGFDLSASGSKDRLAAVTVYSNGLMACSLSQVGGDGGSDIRGPSWTYDVFDVNTGDKVGEGLAPSNRIFTTQTIAATGGEYRTSPSGDVDLWFAYEQPDLDNCQSSAGSA